jgi:hypothetical protein
VLGVTENYPSARAPRPPPTEAARGATSNAADPVATVVDSRLQPAGSR